MEAIAIVAALVFAALALMLFFKNADLHKRIVSLDKDLKDAQSATTDEKPKAESKTKTKTETVTVTDPELEKDLDDARSEIKDLKQKIYDLKQSSKDLKQKLSDAAEDRVADVPDSDIMFELREEIAQLKTDNVRLEDELAAAKKSRKSAPEEKKPEPKKEEKPPEPKIEPTGDAKVDQLRERYEKELSTLHEEVRDLERKLKSTASNVDKQRRRADNNDRAYKITQRQYDAAQERVTLLEAQLEKAGISPVPLAVEEAPAPKAPEPAPAPESKPAPAAAAITKRPASKADELENESTSTAVLNLGAIAATMGGDSDSEAEADESAEESGGTISRAKPVAPEDVAPAAPAAVPPKIRPRAEEPAADESGGHTAVLRPGALAAAVTPKAAPAADESGGHTAVLTPGSLSNALNPASEPEEEAPAADESGGHTAILTSGAAFPKIGAPAQDDSEGSDEEESKGSGLFGMPAGMLSNEKHGSQDKARSTQFAFPTQMSSDDDDDSGHTQKFSMPTAGRLGAPTATKDADEEEKSEPSSKPSGSRLGDMDFGDIGSAIDDAWDDLDID